MVVLLMDRHSHSILSPDPMLDFSKAWLSFWRREGWWRSPSYVQNARNSNVQATHPHRAATAVCFTISPTLYKLTQFLRQFVRLAAMRSSSCRNFIASSIFSSSAGATRNRHIGTIPHHQKKLISPTMCYQHSRASLSSV